LDLHIAGQSPDRDEQSAVDSVLGPLQDGKTESYHLQQERPDRSQRHLLLPVLHAINSRIGWISPGALNYACSRLNLPPAEAFGVANFYGLFSMNPRPRVVMHVCDDIACLIRGSPAICGRLAGRLGPGRGGGAADARPGGTADAAPARGLRPPARRRRPADGRPGRAARPAPWPWAAVVRGWNRGRTRHVLPEIPMNPGIPGCIRAIVALTINSSPLRWSPRSCGSSRQCLMIGDSPLDSWTEAVGTYRERRSIPVWCRATTGSPGVRCSDSSTIAQVTQVRVGRLVA